MRTVLRAGWVVRIKEQNLSQWKLSEMLVEFRNEVSDLVRIESNWILFISMQFFKKIFSLWHSEYIAKVL